MPLVRHKIKRYDWAPDALDQRDHLYAAPVVQLTMLSPKVDLRPRRSKGNLLPVPAGKVEKDNESQQ